MPVTLDPEHYRALWGGIVGLTFFLALALWHLRRVKRPSPADRGRPALSLLARAAKTSGLPPALAYPIFTLALALLTLGLVGAVTVVAATILQTLTQGAAAASLGAGALIAALLGAPFILWRSLVAQRTVNIAQESHITDLIAKAVEQLGAEKTIDRIGRPVTVWTGTPTQIVVETTNPAVVIAPPRSIEIGRGPKMVSDGSLIPSVNPGVAVTYEVWPTELTRIEWRGTPLASDDDKEVLTPGAWEVFSETVPNLEVRIGAILALERLARQNLDVHVQIMEILTAYIRENAKAKDAPKLPEPPEYSPEDHEGWNKAFDTWREKHDDALTDIRPREDIQTALSVIGRRSSGQREEEARWQNLDPDARFSFDDPHPPYPDVTKASYDPTAHDAWVKNHVNWVNALGQYQGYRMDLRRTNLCGADLTTLNLAGALFDEAQMQGAHFSGTQIQGAEFYRAQMQGAEFHGAQLQGAAFHGAQMQGARFGLAEMQGAQFDEATMQGAGFDTTQMQNATFDSAKMQEAEFFDAQMQQSGLFEAQVEGATFVLVQLHQAQMQGTQFDGAAFNIMQFSDTTYLSRASLRNVRLREVDLRPTPRFLAEITPYFPTLFADASVFTPDDHPRPAHWPTWELDPETFDSEYDKWRASPATYLPPPRPT